jgi:excisionase family DNA binding protein
MPPTFLTARELARELEVSYETILAWSRHGVIPSLRDGRHRLLFNLDSVLTTLRTATPPTALPPPRPALKARPPRRGGRALSPG